MQFGRRGAEPEEVLRTIVHRIGESVGRRALAEVGPPNSGYVLHRACDPFPDRRRRCDTRPSGPAASRGGGSERIGPIIGPG